LWITAWLIEALIRLKGFAGLRDGFRLTHHFCETFWKDVHPQDMATRFAQLAGLNGTDSEGTLIAAIMNVPLTASNSVRPLSCADYKDAAELERKDPKVRARRADQGAVTIEMFQRAIAETDVDDLRNVLDDVQQALEAYGSLNALLTQNVSDKSLLPPSSRIRDALDECLRTFRALTKDVLPKDGETMSADQTAAAAAIASANPSHSSVAAGIRAAGIETRQEALLTLMRVAEYFRHAEPHSPISYALEQAVRWARLSLPELLSELVTDKSAREEIFKRAGITPPNVDK
jgi:type VI secretion system protein ImpA